MNATLVPDKLTPLTIDELVTGMAAGYVRTMGGEPAPVTLAILVAQACLETGNGNSIHCYNLGNVKRAADWDGLYCQFRCNEIINGKVEWFDPPHPQTSFRAFSTAAEGCAEFVAFLATRERYAKAWHEAVHGDADTFVRELAKAGYFTAHVDSYAKAVVAITTRVLPACLQIVHVEDAGMTAVDRALVDQMTASWLAATKDAIAWDRKSEQESA